MAELASLAVVCILGAYFVILGLTSIFAPHRVICFFGHFAQSRFKHYIEMLARILVGLGLVSYSTHMFHSSVFRIFGWVLVVTSAGLLLVPWRAHQQFANRVVPWMAKYIAIVGLISLALGVFVFMGVTRGHIA